MDTITLDLIKASEGDEASTQRVWTLLHSDIHNIASRLMAGESPSPTLQSTVLISEAYIKLFNDQIPKFENRNHFLAIISKTMSRYLIDRARKRNALKRGGDKKRITLTIAIGELARYDTISSDSGIEALVALEKFHDESPEAADVAHHLFILGLTIEQTAISMGISPSTVKRKWIFAKASLKEKLSSGVLNE
jgi:RNA polymerase sigma factor (TIGR02999 family)